MAISRSQMRTQLTGDRMPAKSEKQRRYMAMAYNDPDMGVPKEVAKKSMKKPAKGYKAGGKAGYHKMPDGTMMKDSEHKMKKGGTVKKYQAGGMASSRRPKMRPEDLMDSENTTAPRRSRRPRRRPKEIEDMMSPDTAVGRGNRASMREAEEMPRMMMGGKVKKMKAGGKVRGAGMAQKGVRPCQMR